MKTTIAILLCLSCIRSHAQDTPSTEDVTPLPPKVQALVDAYEREKQRVLAPVERKYDQALSELKTQLTKAGRLDGALAVNKIIDSRNPEPEPRPKPVKKDFRWKWASGGELVLSANGKCKHTNWKEEGTWERQEDGSIVIENEHGGHIITFLDDGTANAKGNRGGGTTKLMPIDE